MSEAAWQNMGSILTAVSLILVALQGLVTLVKVHRVEKHTNSMVEQMVKSAGREGRQEGREQAEAQQASSAELSAAVPLVVAPGVRQAEIVRFIAEGIAQGILIEKARRKDEGNGPP